MELLRSDERTGEDDGSATEKVVKRTLQELLRENRDSVKVTEQRKTQISIIVEEDRSVAIGDVPKEVHEIVVTPGTVTSDTPSEEAVREDIPETAAEEMQDDPVYDASTDTVSKRNDVSDIIVTDPIPDFELDNKEETEMPSEPDKVGTIYGNVGTNNFYCRVCAHLERSEYVMVDHEDYGLVLCQVNSLVRKSNLSLEKSLNVNADTVIKETISAQINVIGYRDERNILMTPRTTFRAGSSVRRADPGLIRKVLGLEINEHTDGYIGLLHGHDLPVALNINELLQRHACILAKTGGGKSYMSGDIIEELMLHNVTCMIIDPHGEYGAMREPGKTGDTKFNVMPKGFSDRIKEFAVISGEYSGPASPLRFTLRTLEAKEILELLDVSDTRAFLPPMKRAIDKLRETHRFYSLKDIIETLTADPDNKNPLLVTELEYLDRTCIFDAKGNAVNDLIEEGKTTVINLKGVKPEIQQMVVKRLSTIAFELRKKDMIPPMMMVIEEAQNYCPQGTQLISSKPLAAIASEGRKFGLGLMVISQRPAKIDKNVLSQCGTQIILKVTNPNDVKAIAQSIEGLTNGMTDDIQTMPIGIAMVVGAGIESPLLVEVRPRMSRHGGSGVKVLEESE